MLNCKVKIKNNIILKSYKIKDCYYAVLSVLKSEQNILKWSAPVEH